MGAPAQSKEEIYEDFVYFQECLNSFNSAWSIIEMLQKTEAGNSLASIAFRMALIEYAKPYTRSDGIYKRKHLLPLPTLSDSDIRLHKQIIDLRNTFLAHSDIRIKDAKVYVSKIQGRIFPGIISNTDPPLPSLTDVKGLIERTLDRLYDQLPEKESRLGVTAPGG